MKSIISWIIFLIDCLIPKNKLWVLFSSFPDMSDNSYAMFRYLHSRNEYQKIIWLVNDISKINLYMKQIKEDVRLDQRNLDKILFVKKKSLKAFYLYLRAKYIFFTHAMYPTLMPLKNHVLVNLWHGMPLKNIGYLDSKNKGIPVSSYTISTSHFYQMHMSKAFGQTINNTLISGQPRNDMMFLPDNSLLKLDISKIKYNKVFLWTPTYRSSNSGDIREDGNITSEMPVIGQNINDLNEVLKKLNAYMIIKQHPMDILNTVKFDNYSNLVFLKNSDLEEKCCQLYSLLGEIDILLTDFSSIYIDYLLLDRPLCFVMDDFDKYEQSRGFVMKSPKDYMPGKFISTKEDLFDFIQQCVQEIDDYKEARKKVNSVLNIQKENFSEYLWKIIIERKEYETSN